MGKILSKFRNRRYYGYKVHHYRLNRPIIIFNTGQTILREWTSEPDSLIYPVKYFPLSSYFTEEDVFIETIPGTPIEMWENGFVVSHPNAEVLEVRSEDSYRNIFVRQIPGTRIIKPRMVPQAHDLEEFGKGICGSSTPER